MSSNADSLAAATRTPQAFSQATPEALPLTSELHDSTAAIAGEWDALADHVGATPFARPGWIEAWLDAFAVARPAIVTVRRGSTLAGVLPLGEHRGARASLTNLYTPRFELLALDAGALEALSAAALDTRRLTLSFMDNGSDATDAFMRTARAAGYAVSIREAEASPEVPISGAWEDYLPTISKNMRREFRRRQKRLEEAGEFTFEVSDGRDDLEARVREAFDVEAASWKGASGTAVAVDADTLAFYLGVAR